MNSGSSTLVGKDPQDARVTRISQAVRWAPQGRHPGGVTEAEPGVKSREGWPEEDRESNLGRGLRITTQVCYLPTTDVPPPTLPLNFFMCKTVELPQWLKVLQ